LSTGLRAQDQRVIQREHLLTQTIIQNVKNGVHLKLTLWGNSTEAFIFIFGGRRSIKKWHEKFPQELLIAKLFLKK
jgi:hypothetical protein